MTWTYSGSPGSNDRDAIRFLVGDTDHEDPLANDEERAWAITQEGNIFLSAAMVARAVGGRFTTQVDLKVGDLAISHSKKATQFETLAKKLEARGRAKGGVPYAGGISNTDKQSRQDDTDRVTPAFSRSMHDSPELPSDQSKRRVRRFDVC